MNRVADGAESSGQPPARGSSGDAPRPTPAERVARGRAARIAVPRSSHATCESGSAKRDPVEFLEQQAVSRLPELVPVRYGRMLTSAFSFYRGSALVMAHDLAATPVTGISTQLCGDAHLSNFGMFSSPERRLVFDLNDFDETLPGPWEWDVKRLAASLAVAGRENGFATRDRRRVLLTAIGRYRTAMREFAALGNLDVWYAHLTTATLQAAVARRLDASQRRRVAKATAKAQTRDNVQAMDKLTRMVDGERRIVADPPLIVPLSDLMPDSERDELLGWFRSLITQYSQTMATDRRTLIDQYAVVDVARKVVGVGSVGTRAWIVLLRGRDGGDPLFLQAKEAQPSVLASYLGDSEYVNQGHRVVAGQRLMQATGDIFLGWQRVDSFDGESRDFYVRQLRDWKGSAVIEGMPLDDLNMYGAVCGWTLARAHARSGDRIAIAAYLGGGTTFEHAVAEFAETYADQNERDHQALVTAAETGRVTARSGL